MFRVIAFSPSNGIFDAEFETEMQASLVEAWLLDEGYEVFSI